MIKMCIQYLLIAAFLVTSFAKCSDFEVEDRNIYAVPEPKIEVFSRGFRVSIPDQEGISLFAFHGNINDPMNDLEAGRFSRDILKKEDNHWVFEDTGTKLHVGDVIYYWLFVIRFNLGYRYDNRHFVVKEIVPCRPLTSDSPIPSQIDKDSKNNWYFEPLDKPNVNFQPQTIDSTSTSKVQANPTQSTAHNTVSTPAVQVEHKSVSTCCQLFLNTTNQMIMLSKQIDRLVEENRILSQIAQKDDHYAKNLRIFGKYSKKVYPTPLDFVLNLISEKLKLHDVKVLEAKTIPDNGISFKVETLKDKINIIIAAQEQLKGSNYELSW